MGIKGEGRYRFSSIDLSLPDIKKVIITDTVDDK
jgi:hypothetical protein